MKKLKRYDEFLIEEIDIKQALVGGAIAAGSLISNPLFSSEPVKKAPIDTIQHSEQIDLKEFLDTLISEKPNIFNNSKSDYIEFGHFERIEYLTKKKNEYEQTIGRKIDLNILSETNNGTPFIINYFFVRGLDDIEKGPFLMQILSLNYNTALKIGNHELMFNFTRIQNVNTFGLKYNL